MKRVSPVPLGPLAPGTSRRAVLTVPQGRITFYTAAGTFSATLGEDPATDLISLTTATQRTVSAQPGKWSATFTLRQGSDGESWVTRADPQDGVFIEMRRDRRDSWTSVFLGYVDDIGGSAVPNGMGSQATVTINGSSILKAVCKPRADFYSALVVKDAQRQYAVATTSAQGLVAPVAGSTVVGLLSSGQQAPVVTTAPGWVLVTLPDGQAWFQSNQVQIVQQADPYAATIADIVKNYGVTENIGGASVQGITEVLMAKAAQIASKPFTASADPPTLIAATLLLWTFKTWNIPWHFGKKLIGLPDILRFALEKPAYGIGVTSAALSPLQGAVWPFFTSFCNEPLFELFCDVRSSAEIDGGNLVNLSNLEQTSDMYDAVDGAVVTNGVLWGDDKAKAVLVYRHTPFNREDWQKLILHKVDPIEAGSRQFAKGDTDVVNLYWPYPDIGALTSHALASEVPALLDATSAVRYGLSSMRVPVRGLPSSDTGFVAAYQKMAEDMWRWYRNNPEYWNTTLQLQTLRPEIKVGQRVLDVGPAVEYYVEGVSHRFQSRTQGTTTLQLSRGQYSTAPLG